MAPVHSRQLLAWSLPTLAVLLSYFWYKRKRLGQQSDIRDTNSNQVVKVVECCDGTRRSEFAANSAPQIIGSKSADSSPRKPFSRSLSGVDTAPIDIIIPPDMRAAKSNQMVISDEDLDLEIEKIKSMRSSLQRSTSKQSPPKPPAVSPPEQQEALFNNNNEAADDDVDSSNSSSSRQESSETAATQQRGQPKPVKETVVKKSASAVCPNNKAAEEAEELPKEVEKSVGETETPAEEAENKTAVDESAAGEEPAAKETENVSATTKKGAQQQQQQQTKPTGKAKRISNRMKDTARTAEVKAVQKEMEEKFSTGRIPVGGKKGYNATKKINNKRLPRAMEKGHAAPGAQDSMGEERKEEAAQRRSSDRDSANHSPADIMMASPSLSNISDNGSSDSGKGGSDVVVTPPNSHTHAYLRCADVVIHEFDVPSDIVGRLIGKKGSFVSQIKIKTNAEIVVKSYPPPFSDQKVCIVEGTPSEIEAALKMIRRKFPLESYPKLTLQPWNSSPVQILPDQLYLKLVEGINNDTIICCVESPVNLFVQFPTHPSFMNLTVLQNFMNTCYSTESPELPKPIPVSAICAARSKDSWFRAQILSAEDEDHSYIKFLDWGGYELVNNQDLRKIRCDFTYLPFQATECILANIQPIEDADEEKQDEAIEYIKDISRTGLVFTQVVDYTPEGVPLVLCFVNVAPNHAVNLNQDLVDRGYAEWIQPVEELQQEAAAAAVMDPVVPTVEQQA